MKFSLILLTVLFAAAAAQLEEVPEPNLPPVPVDVDGTTDEIVQEPNLPPVPVDVDGTTDEIIQEGTLDYGQIFNEVVVKGLNELAEFVGVKLIKKAAYILTDRLHLSPTKEVQDALQSGFSTEGVINATGYLILGKAAQLAEAQAVEQGGPSQEALISIAQFYKIYEAEQGLSFQYSQSIPSEGVSQEGILGGLGGLILNGLGDFVGGEVGNIISGAGNIIGSLFVARPGQQEFSHEGIVSEIGNAGILTSSGQLVVKGAAKTARSLIKGLYKPYGEFLKNDLWFYRGYYSGYSSIQEPGKEALLQARAIIHQHSEAEQCIEGAEANLTVLFNQYVENGQGCFAVGQSDGQNIIAHVFDIILDAVKRVEDVYRETAYCFERQVVQNTIACLTLDIPALIEGHKEKFEYYGRHLTEYVQQFTDFNTQFDVCLTRHLGLVRSDVYNIIYDFHKCVGEQVGHKRKNFF